MTVDIAKLGKVFSGGTISCAIAHNLSDPFAALDFSVLQEASKTGAVLAALTLLRWAGGITIKQVAE